MRVGIVDAGVRVRSLAHRPAAGRELSGRGTHRGISSSHTVGIGGSQSSGRGSLGRRGGHERDPRCVRAKARVEVEDKQQ
jgi:hypothetical protein